MEYTIQTKTVLRVPRCVLSCAFKLAVVTVQKSFAAAVFGSFSRFMGRRAALR